MNIYEDLTSVIPPLTRLIVHDFSRGTYSSKFLALYQFSPRCISPLTNSSVTLNFGVSRGSVPRRENLQIKILGTRRSVLNHSSRTSPLRVQKLTVGHGHSWRVERSMFDILITELPVAHRVDSFTKHQTYFTLIPDY